MRFFENVSPGASDYIRQRCRSQVIPRLKTVVTYARAHDVPVLYLRLCGRRPDRSDLHRHFLAADRESVEAGFGHIYPLSNEPLAAVVPAVAPQPGDVVLDKVTYSGFTSTQLEPELHRLGLETVVMAGLATSQCVDTTARDASDRGFRILHLEDAQADYQELSHGAALYSSRLVCGGKVLSCGSFLHELKTAPDELFADR